MGHPTTKSAPPAPGKGGLIPQANDKNASEGIQSEGTASARGHRPTRGANAGVQNRDSLVDERRRGDVRGPNTKPPPAKPETFTLEHRVSCRRRFCGQVVNVQPAATARRSERSTITDRPGIGPHPVVRPRATSAESSGLIKATMNDLSTSSGTRQPARECDHTRP